MSDTKQPEKVKRPYRANGAPLSYDLRVRLDADTANRLAAAAKRKKTTRAALARDILNSALSPNET